MSTAIGLMARAPSAGGKTRLAPHIAPNRLHSLRSALLANTLRALRDVPDVVLFFTPNAAENEVALLCDIDMPRVPQGDGDLGCRMLGAIRELLETRRFRSAILIGADIPWLGADRVREAEEILRTAGGIVLGPADDGGYYLIGMTQAHAHLFDGIAWGTDRVLAETLKAAQQIGVQARLLRHEYDVDTIDDLRRLEQDLERAPAETHPDLRRWFSES